MGKPRIERGSRVTLHFTLCLAHDDRIADTTTTNEPLTVEIGSGDMIEGLENRLIGLRAGEKRRFEVPCEEAYGPVEGACVQSLPRDVFPAHLQLEAGQLIAFAGPNGEEIPGAVVEVENERVFVDFTHPLAGHDLVFDVEILDVQPQRR